MLWTEVLRQRIHPQRPAREYAVSTHVCHLIHGPVISATQRSIQLIARLRRGNSSKTAVAYCCQVSEVPLLH